MRSIESLFLGSAKGRGTRTIDQLDGLRALAIVAVFVQHLGDRYRPFVDAALDKSCPRAVALWAHVVLHHAFWGVDLFFVVSGFSLSLRFLDAASGDKARVSVRAFFARRAARIFPAYLVAIAVMIADRPEVLRSPGMEAALLSHVTLLQGYLRSGGVVFIGAAWSLTTEAHFYLLMPWLAHLLFSTKGQWQSQKRALFLGFAVCAAVWALRAALHAVVLTPGIVTPWLETTQRHWVVCRLDQFVLGMMAALVAKDLRHPERETSPPGVLPSWSRRVPMLALGRGYGLVAAALALVVCFRLEEEFYLVPGGSCPYALVSIATAAFVLLAVAADAAKVPWLTARPVRVVGVLSYGIFLYHQLVLRWIMAVPSLAGEPTARGLVETGVVSFALATALAAVSWILVERPALAAVERFLTSDRGAHALPRTQIAGDRSA